MDNDETIEELESVFQESDDVAMSAIVRSDSVAFPLRIADPDAENFDGEPDSFDEAYDFAAEVLGTEDLSVSKDGGYLRIEASAEQ